MEWNMSPGDKIEVLYTTVEGNNVSQIWVPGYIFCGYEKLREQWYITFCTKSAWKNIKRSNKNKLYTEAWKVRPFIDVGESVSVFVSSYYAMKPNYISTWEDNWVLQEKGNILGNSLHVKRSSDGFELWVNPKNVRKLNSSNEVFIKDLIEDIPEDKLAELMRHLFSIVPDPFFLLRKEIKVWRETVGFSNAGKL